MLTLIKEASFEGRIVYTVERDWTQKEPAYRGTLDFREFSGYMPSEESMISFDLDCGVVDAVISEIKRTPVVIWPPVQMGVDGETYELRLGDGYFGGVTLRWWCWVPDDWRRLMEVLAPLIPLAFAGWLQAPPKVKAWHSGPDGKRIPIDI